jgi:hypothetical protein
MKVPPDMTPSDRPAAPEIDSVALATTIAAYQRSRRQLKSLRAHRPAPETASDLIWGDGPLVGDTHHALIHATRIARARLRSVITTAVCDAVNADVPKATLVRRINERVNALVRDGAIDPDGPILAEIIEWIIEGYPSEILLDTVARGARPTPPHSRDIIPLRLMGRERAS